MQLGHSRYTLQVMVQPNDAFTQIIDYLQIFPGAHACFMLVTLLSLRDPYCNKTARICFFAWYYIFNNKFGINLWCRNLCLKYGCIDLTSSSHFKVDDTPNGRSPRKD